MRKVNDIDVIVSKNIREKRLLSGISRKKAASHLGVTHQQMQKYENGVNRISASALYKLSILYNTSLRDFFDNDNILLPKEPKKDRTLVDLNNLYINANENVQKAVINILRISEKQ